MQITVDITEDDLWRFTRRVAWRNRTARFNVVGNVLGPPIVLGCLVYFASVRGWAAPALVLVGTLASWALTYAIMRRQVLRVAHPGALGQHLIELDEAGIRERTAVNDSFTAWSGVAGVDRDGHALYLMLGALMAHIVPLRSFSTPEEAERFAAAAHAFRAAATTA